MTRDPRLGARMPTRAHDTRGRPASGTPGSRPPCAAAGIRPTPAHWPLPGRRTGWSTHSGGNRASAGLATRAAREQGLRAAQHLDLRLLVHAEHDRVRWRIQIQSDHVLDLLRRLGIGGELERRRAPLAAYLPRRASPLEPPVAGRRSPPPGISLVDRAQVFGEPRFVTPHDEPAR